MQENPNNLQNNVNLENADNNDKVVLNTSNEHTSSGISIEQVAADVHKKRENNKKLVILLFSIVAAIIILVGLILVFSLFNKKAEYTHTENYPLYQYFAGEKELYEGKLTISNNNDVVEIKNDDGVVGIEDAPIYFQKVDNEVLVSKNMLLVFPRINNKNYKVPLFTKLTYESDSEASFYYIGKDKIFLEDSFLYDGNDLYLFLYETTLQVGDKTYELSPLSFVIVNYHESVEFYDKENDKYEIIENCNYDIIATLGSHKINLSTDMLNDNRLLLKSVKDLPIYKK